MTLAITVVAAAVAVTLWARSTRARELRVGVLCYLFGGASLMWSVDLVAALAEGGPAALAPAPAEALDDALLGLAVVALGLGIWLASLLVARLRGPRLGAPEALARRAR